MAEAGPPALKTHSGCGTYDHHLAAGAIVVDLTIVALVVGSIAYLGWKLLSRRRSSSPQAR